MFFFFLTESFVVAVQKRRIIEPKKVLGKGFSVVLFCVAYGAQTKGIDDLIYSVKHALGWSLVWGDQCLSHSQNISVINEVVMCGIYSTICFPSTVYMWQIE